ncbi:MAG: MBL fold metallo-hydrolase [Solirubrobacterales bacterium]|nr:MBL fold metallo-hydrolase [Solirubrobacterales bacterium]MCB8915891.1 MBL fold metallo-hydrolase [Thermoleophilales bacterium]
MIIQRVEQFEWLSNSYLVCDSEGGTGVLIDGNGVIEPLLERVDREGITLTHILLTHEHWDHVVDLREVADRYGVPILASQKTADLVDFKVDEIVEDGDETISGGLTIKWIATPGHSDGHMALLINGTDVITADVIFKGTVGGTVAPGESGFPELKSSIMDRLMTLPPETRIHPGHREPSTVGEEWENNPFIRVWRGLDQEGSEPCEVNNFGSATLILWAPDYDGTNKAWIRLPDGEDKITGGSQILSRG